MVEQDDGGQPLLEGSVQEIDRLGVGRGLYLGPKIQKNKLDAFVHESRVCQAHSHRLGIQLPVKVVVVVVVPRQAVHRQVRQPIERSEYWVGKARGAGWIFVQPQQARKRLVRTRGSRVHQVAGANQEVELPGLVRGNMAQHLLKRVRCR